VPFTVGDAELERGLSTSSGPAHLSADVGVEESEDGYGDVVAVDDVDLGGR
jgi:hypothetical protein